MWNLEYGTNELIYKTEIDIEVRLTATSGEGVKEGRTGSVGLADVNYYI